MKTETKRKPPKAANNPVPVRIDEKTKRRLKRAAKKLGSTTSGIIKICIAQQLDEIEKGAIIIK